MDSTISLDPVTRQSIRDLHRLKPAIFWADFLASASLGWGAFALALRLPNYSLAMIMATLVSAFSLYRCLCFTHEITHFRRDSAPGFESTWNALAGIPLLLPTFAYVGVHQSHHSLSTYGTVDDPEYLPFAKSRSLIFAFALQSAFLVPVLVFLRFVVLGPVGLLVPAFHRWLEVHASSFSMNPRYRRVVSAEASRKMKRWEIAILLVWLPFLAAMLMGAVPVRVFVEWWLVSVIVSFFNTLRVLGAHEYDSDGQVLSRDGQLADSIDTPGAFWTALWAPVGLRYHALHHYFPGIPYHNLGRAYRLLTRQAPAYAAHSSPSLVNSLRALLRKARRARA